MNKICVYAIAKNEEKNVERWVASMRPADHIIVLDTGSTDRTVELLTSLGVEVHQTSYEHFRFDIARNDALALVPDEYNIRVSTDLDEFWEQSNWADIVRENWDDTKPRMIYKYVWSHSQTGENGLEFIINKIHGKDNIGWKGAVHEYLYDTETGSKMFKAYVDMINKLTLHHDINHIDKTFYLDLAKERVKEQPEDFQSWFLLGNEQRVKGDPHDAIETYKYIVEHFQEEDTWELAGVYYYLGMCYQRVGNAPQAMQSWAAGVSINRYYRDNYFGLGVIFLDSKLYDMAIGVLLEALHTTKRAYGWMEDPCTWTYGIYDLLGLAYYHKEDYAAALGYASKALTFDPQNSILQQRYANYLQLLN